MGVEIFVWLFLVVKKKKNLKVVLVVYSMIISVLEFLGIKVCVILGVKLFD